MPRHYEDDDLIVPTNPLTEESVCQGCMEVFAFPSDDASAHFCKRSETYYLCPTCRADAGLHLVPCAAERAEAAMEGDR